MDFQTHEHMGWRVTSHFVTFNYTRGSATRYTVFGGSMDYRDIISMLDAEIGRLEEAGRLLKQGGKVDAAIKAVTTRQQKAVAMPKKRVLSPEARARIAEAQRKRWAASKK